MDALQFPQIWLPANCSTHRFTNASINAFVSHILKTKGTPKGRLEIFMLGDSAMRGLFCGISRILAGSEVLGPCSNAVCGTSPHNLVQANLMNKLIPVDFGPNLRITFAFLISLRVQHTDWIIEAAIKAKPYAVVFNTGAWDFDIISRLHMKEISSDYCTNETEAISVNRANPTVKAVMRELGGYARQLGVRAIYRNSHFNARYGAHCADDRVEKMLIKSGWDVWDNRNISKDVWRNQTYDGFHFDRTDLHTVADHVQGRKESRAAGMMEMALTQSLLHQLFGDTVQQFVQQGLLF